MSRIAWPFLSFIVIVACAPTISGTATLIGLTEHSGTTVTAVTQPGPASTVTRGNGDFSLAAPSDGPFTLSLVNGDFEETVPGVLVRGGKTMIGPDAPVPLPPFEVPRAHRVLSAVQAWVVARAEDGSSAIVSAKTSANDWTLSRVPLVGSGQPILLAERVADWQRSPRGEQVFFATTNGAISSAPVVGTGVSPLAPAAAYGEWVFSPDGSTAVLLSSPSRLCSWTMRSVPAAGGAVTPLATSVCHTPQNGLGPFYRLWFSQHGHVIFMSAAGLSSVPLTGGTPAMLGTNVDVASVALSPDGTRVCFADTLPARHLFVASLDGRPALDLGSTSGSCLFSPDGSKVAFKTATGALHLASVDGNSNLELATGVTGRFFFAKDGRRLFYFVDLDQFTGALFVVTPGQAASSLAPAVSRILPPAFSPDGRWLAFVSVPPGGSDYTGHQYVFALDDGSLVDLGWGGSFFRYTTDSSKLYFVSTVGDECVGTLTMFDTASRQRRALAGGVNSNPSNLRFPPGSNRPFFVTHADCAAQTGSLLTAEPDGSAVTTIATNVGATIEFQFSPSGSHVIYCHDVEAVHGTWKVDARPVTGGSSHTLFTGVSSQPLATFSPDGARALGYAPGGDGAPEMLELATLDGSAATVSLAISRPDGAFSPDGTRVSYTDVDGNLAVRNAAGASTTYLGRVAYPSTTWFSNDAILAVRTGTPEPLGFQNGVYVVHPMP